MRFNGYLVYGIYWDITIKPRIRYPNAWSWEPFDICVGNTLNILKTIENQDFNLYIDVVFPLLGWKKHCYIMFYIFHLLINRDNSTECGLANQVYWFIIIVIWKLHLWLENTCSPRYRTFDGQYTCAILVSFWQFLPIAILSWVWYWVSWVSWV